MRHLKTGRKLGRNSSHRKAMFRNMTTSLLLHGQIKTTLAKAKELRRYIEPLITLGRKHAPSTLEGLGEDDLKARKLARYNAVQRAAIGIKDKDALYKLFNDYAERFKERPGGYTRIVKAGYRSGDNAPMAIIVLINDEQEEAEEAVEVADTAEEIESAEE
jgi:large subunit ribosomal protein L17